jgi:hypothetical protein
MTTRFDRRPFVQTHQEMRDLVSKPIDSWMTLPPVLRTVPAYAPLLAIPLELSAAGYLVTTCQTGSGWCITIEKAITDTAVLHLQGEATSYAHAWFQVADQVDLVLEDLEALAKRAAREGAVA